MPAKTIDPDAVNWICHSSIDCARHYVRKANRATCEGAIRELDHIAAAAGATGPAPAYKTLRKMIAARLRRLLRNAHVSCGLCDGCGHHSEKLTLWAGTQWANCPKCHQEMVQAAQTRRGAAL